MAKKLTLKEYLKSKEQLREAVKLTPCQQKRYVVNKYCRLVVGENKETKHQLSLKPNHQIVVDWLYEDFYAPIPTNITLTGVGSILSNANFKPAWKGKQLIKWLTRNTREHKNMIF